MDKNLRFQQNLAAHPIGVVLLRARGNRIDDLRPLGPRSSVRLRQLNQGEFSPWVHDEES